MRWDSPIVLVGAGTAAIHTLLVVFIDAVVVTHPFIPPTPAPVIEMVEVEVEPPKPPEPPKIDIPPEPEPEPEVVQQRPQPQVRQPQVRSQPETPPPETPPIPGPPGGDDPPVVPLADPTPGRGLVPPPARATRSGTGRGGSGGGSGTGTGSGAGDPPPAPPPVSVATIKKAAMPKGDYGYIDAGKDYPASARQLGIEGKIRVKLVVDATGKVRSAVLLDSLGHGLDELAMTRSKLIEFEPARDTDDKAVASVVVWTFNMALPK